jgi:hypothetical protein
MGEIDNERLTPEAAAQSLYKMLLKRDQEEKQRIAKLDAERKAEQQARFERDQQCMQRMVARFSQR